MEALVLTASPFQKTWANSHRVAALDASSSWKLNQPVFCQTNEALHFHHKLVHERGLIDPPVCLIHQFSLGRVRGSPPRHW